MTSDSVSSLRQTLWSTSRIPIQTVLLCCPTTCSQPWRRRRRGSTLVTKPLNPELEKLKFSMRRRLWKDSKPKILASIGGRRERSILLRIKVTVVLAGHSQPHQLWKVTTFWKLENYWVYQSNKLLTEEILAQTTNRQVLAATEVTRPVLSSGWKSDKPLKTTTLTLPRMQLVIHQDMPIQLSGLKK